MSMSPFYSSNITTRITFSLYNGETIKSQSKIRSFYTSHGYQIISISNDLSISKNVKIL